jgi:hypothetical protein
MGTKREGDKKELKIDEEGIKILAEFYSLALKIVQRTHPEWLEEWQKSDV